jgi:hypothetical protein
VPEADLRETGGIAMVVMLRASLGAFFCLMESKGMTPWMHNPAGTWRPRPLSSCT